MQLGTNTNFMICIFWLFYRKLAQVAAGTAFVAVSVHYGVWGTTYNGSKVVERVRTKILPTANEYLVQVTTALHLM